jgi:hypothetical protein
MAKHKYIETPEKMWNLFEAYRNEIKDNPIQIVEQKKGTVIIPKSFEGDLGELYQTTIHLPQQRPLTMEGFLNYLDDNDIISDATDYFENKDNRYEGYVRICKRIKRVIRQDQIEGGMAGIYNPSITQRLNGLTEKTDIMSGGQPLQRTIIKWGDTTLEV